MKSFAEAKEDFLDAVVICYMAVAEALLITNACKYLVRKLKGLEQWLGSFRSLNRIRSVVRARTKALLGE